MRPWPFVAALMALPAMSQEMRWQLPERGGALYRRQLKVDVKSEPEGVELPEVWAGEHQPGTVLTGELDERRQRRSAPLWDLRELVADIALDLSVTRAGKSRALLRTGDRFQPVGVATQGGDGSWSSANDTAFGLLFLKKAALPAITGR